MLTYKNVSYLQNTHDSVTIVRLIFTWIDAPQELDEWSIVYQQNNDQNW